MWWHDRRTTAARFGGLAAALALSTLLAGCFEPLYGEKTLAGGPGLRQRLSSVTIDPLSAPSNRSVSSERWCLEKSSSMPSCSTV